LYKLFLEPLHRDPCLAPGLEIYIIEVFTLSWTPFNNSVNNWSASCSLVSDTFNPLLEDFLPIFVVFRIVKKLLEYILVSFIVKIVGKSEDLITLVVSKINYVSEQAM
jgi:hypothetical protein